MWGCPKWVLLSKNVDQGEDLVVWTRSGVFLPDQLTGASVQRYIEEAGAKQSKGPQTSSTIANR